MPHKRLRRVARISNKFAQRGYPRLTMVGIVGGAAATAFLVSASLLWAGVRSMPVRYSIAALLGYAAFVWLVSWWLPARGRRQGGVRLIENAADAVDVAQMVDLSGSLLRTAGSTGRVTPVEVFQGGRSGGAGASAALGGGPAQSETVSLAAGLDDESIKLLPLFAAAAIFVGLFAAGSVVWSAPHLLAEIVVDGAIAGQAYRRLRTGSWTGGVVRRTWKPMLAILVSFVLLGVAGHYFDPDADSIGDLFR